MKTTAVIYSRVSTLDQNNERQIQELKEFSNYKKFQLLKVFEEKITGASKASERLEFKKLLEFIDKNKVDTLLVWELSRLGRSMMDVLNTIELLSNRKINIYIKKEGMNTLDEKGNKSVMTTMLISIMSGFAEMEKENIRMRSISGIRQNVFTGGSGTGVIKAYGFKKVDKKLVIDADEAKVIKLIFEKYLSGLGTQQIAKFLNEENIPTRYNKLFADKKVKQRYGHKKGSDYTWKDGTVYTILTNSIYAGERKHKGEIFKIEPIISKSIFEKVQIRLSENFNKKDSNRIYENPLKDLLICGNCGQSYFMHKRHNGKDNAYKCLSKRYNEYCGNPSISIDKLIRSLYVTTASVILANSKMSKEHKENINTQINGIDANIRDFEKQLREIIRQKNNLIKLNLSGNLTVAEFSKFKKELEVKGSKIEDHINRLTAEKDRLEQINNSYSKNVNNINEEIFKTQISKAVKQITINAAPSNFKLENKQDVGVKISVIPVINQLPSTDYIITQRTSNIYYLKKNKVVETLPL